MKTVTRKHVEKALANYRAKPQCFMLTYHGNPPTTVRCDNLDKANWADVKVVKVILDDRLYPSFKVKAR